MTLAEVKGPTRVRLLVYLRSGNPYPCHVTQRTLYSESVSTAGYLLR